MRKRRFAGLLVFIGSLLTLAGMWQIWQNDNAATSGKDLLAIGIFLILGGMILCPYSQPPADDDKKDKEKRDA